MSRLAKMLEHGKSSDILSMNIAPVELEERRKLEEKARKESGTVSTKLDLSLFRRFDASNQAIRNRRDSNWFYIDNRGNINLTVSLSEKFKDGAKVAIYLNQKCTLMVVREEPNGIPLVKLSKAAPRRSIRRCTCREIARMLEQAGVKLPTRFVAAWDDELKAWVGRRQDG